MRKFFVLSVMVGMILEGGCASAPPRVQEGPVHCRLASRAAGGAVAVLEEADLDTRSKDAAAYTVEAVIHDGRRLSATVRHVDIRMPRERFNVALVLDGGPHVRLNHIDLDIYLETAIDGEVYLLHCFRDFESPFSSGN